MVTWSFLPFAFHLYAMLNLFNSAIYTGKNKTRLIFSRINGPNVIYDLSLVEGFCGIRIIFTSYTDQIFLRNGVMLLSFNF